MVAEGSTLNRKYGKEQK